jgi:hypothetical protein
MDISLNPALLEIALRLMIQQSRTDNVSILWVQMAAVSALSGMIYAVM